MRIDVVYTMDSQRYVRYAHPRTAFESREWQGGGGCSGWQCYL